jgi:hypothetical protein
MSTKEQTVDAEPETQAADDRPKTLVPDYEKEAKRTEAKIGAAFGGPILSLEETVSGRAPSERARVASLLQAQRDQGNYYVQQTIEHYHKKAPSPSAANLAPGTGHQAQPAQQKLSGDRAVGQPMTGVTPVPSAGRSADAAMNQGKHSAAAPAPGTGNYYVERAKKAYLEAHPADSRFAKAVLAQKSGGKAPAAADVKGQSTAAPPSESKDTDKVQGKQAQTAARLHKTADAKAEAIAKPGETAKAPSPKERTAGDQKLPTNAAKEEARTAAVPIDRQGGKAQLVAGKPAKQSGDGPGGGAVSGGEVQQWSIKVRGAAQKTLTPPDLKGPEDAPERIKKEGDKLLQQRQHQPNYLEEANKNLPPAPKSDHPPEAAPEAVEKNSRDLIAGSAGHRLTNQSLPQLEMSPGYAKDDKKVAPRMPSFTPAAPTTEVDLAPKDKSGADQVKTDTTKTDEIQKKIDQPATLGQTTSPPQLTIEDKGPAPKPVLPDSMKSDITGAVGLVLSKSGDAAQEVITKAERAAFPDDALVTLEPEVKVGEKHRDPEKNDIDKELHQVADAAGLEKGAIDERAKKLAEDAKKEGDKNAADLDAAAAKAKQDEETTGKEKRASIKTASNSVKNSIDKKSEAANVPLDNKAVEEREQKIEQQLKKDGALGRAHYSRALEKREADLDNASATYASAYQTAAKQEANDIKTLYKDEEEKGRVESRPSLDWGDKEVKIIREMLPALKRDASKEAESFKIEITKQEIAALDMVHSWTNDHLSTWQSLWRRFLDLFTSWAKDAKIETDAWEQVRDEETTTQMAADLGTIATLKDLAAKGNIAKLQAAVTGLSQDQQALLLLFFQTGSDSVMTLASALLSRMEARRVPKLTEQLKTEVLELDWEKLNILGKAENREFDANAQAWEVHNAIAGIGTNEERLFAAIGRRTPVQIAAMRKCYAFLFPATPDMDSEIADDLSGDEADRAQAALASDKTGEDVFALHDAVDSFDTDEAAIMRILRNKTPEERDAIFARYQKKYGRDLKDHLHKELTGDDKDRADALLAGDTTKADAIAVQQSMHYHWYGGAEVKELDAVYSQIRKEVEGDAASKNMTTSEVEAEIKRRNQAVQSEWEAKYGEKKPGSMTDALKDRFGHAEKDFALALSENDRTAQDSARIGMESQSAYTSDEKVLQILMSQRARAESDVQRDLAVHVGELREKAVKEKWPPEQFKQKSDEMKAQAEKDIDEKAGKNLGKLEEVYDKNYSKGWGPGALTAVVELEMGGQQQAMARQIRKKGGAGKLSPEDEIYYSVVGLGHDVDHLKHALLDESGHPRYTRKQLEAMNENYKKDPKHQGRDMFEDIGGEIITGRDGFDVNQAVKGKPETPEEIRQYINAKTTYELGGSGGVGFLFAPDESLALYKTSLEADKVYNEYLKAKNEEKNPAKAEALLKRYEQWSNYTDNAVQGTRESVDAITNHVAMVAAIVVGIVVAIATAGTATPAVVAAISALAATGTGIAVKAAMKGTAYSLEELGTDAAVGAVDVAAAALTAGVGSVLLRTNLLTRLAERQLLGRLASQGIAHGVGGMLAGIPAGVAGQVLDPRTWKSDDVAKAFLLGTLQTAGTGFAFGSTLGIIHGVKAPTEAHATGKTSPKLELHDVANVKKPPDITANAKTVADARPLNNVETQLKPIVNADEHPHTPGSPEDELAKNVAKTKAILDPATPESKIASAEKDPVDVMDSGKAAKAPTKATATGTDVTSQETKLSQPDSLKKAVVPSDEAKAAMAGEEKKGLKPVPEGAEVKIAEKGTGVVKPAEKAVTDEGKQKVVEPEKLEPAAEKKTSAKQEPPSTEELKSARKERTQLEEQKEAGKKLIAEKQLAVDDKKGEITDLEFDLNENLKKTPRTPALEKELTEIKRQLIEPQRDLAKAQRELESIAKHFESKIKSIDGRLAEIKAIEDQFKGSKPWRQAVVVDDPNPPSQDAHNKRISVYGELETATKLEDAGFKPKGSTLRPEDVVVPEDFDNAVKEREGKQDIDHLYDPPDKTKWKTYAVESKTTATPVDGDPTGVGKLTKTENGYQLSDKWLIGNAPKSGLNGAEREAFIKAVNEGQVRKVYALTDPNGTRFFEVESIGDTGVKIGKEITHEFKKP